jgi:hypothetical protein
MVHRAPSPHRWRDGLRDFLHRRHPDATDIPADTECRACSDDDRGPCTCPEDCGAIRCSGFAGRYDL